MNFLSNKHVQYGPDGETEELCCDLFFVNTYEYQMQVIIVNNILFCNNYTIYNEKYFSDGHFSYIVRVIT